MALTPAQYEVGHLSIKGLSRRKTPQTQVPRIPAESIQRNTFRHGKLDMDKANEDTLCPRHGDCAPSKQHLQRGKLAPANPAKILLEIRRGCNKTALLFRWCIH